MPTTVQSFYIGLLADPEASPELQRRIFAYAKKRKATSVLAALAAHPALVPALDDELGEIPNAAVKAAWARRPDRSKQVLETLARKDTRGSVLEGIANLQDLSDEGFMAIAKRNQPKADWVLVTNPAVPLEVKQVCAANLGASITSSSWRSHQKLLAALQDQPELFDALASRAKAFPVFKLVAGSEELSTDTQLRMVTRISDVMAEYSKVGSGRNSHAWQLSGEAREALDLAQALAGNPAFEDRPVDLLKVALEAFRPSDQWMQSLAATALAAIQGRSAGTKQARRGPNPLTVARTTTDQAELEAFAASAAANSNQVLALAVAANPHAGADVVARVADRLPWNGAQRILARRGTELAVAVELLAAHTHLVTDDALARTGDPVRALLDVTSKLTARRRPLPPAITTSRYVTPDTACLLSVAYLAHAEIPVTTRRVTAEAIERSLGGREALWEIFETVGEQFEGSLAELLSTCEMLAPAPEPGELEQEEALFDRPPAREPARNGVAPEPVVDAVPEPAPVGVAPAPVSGPVASLAPAVPAPRRRRTTAKAVPASGPGDVQLTFSLEV